MNGPIDTALLEGVPAKDLESSISSPVEAHSRAIELASANAMLAGCSVEVTRRRVANLRNRPFQELLLVNGKLCSLQCSTKRRTNKFARRSYAKVMISLATLSSVQYAICCSLLETEEPRIFVFPSMVLQKAYLEPPKPYAMLWLPVDRLPSYNNMKARVPYWDYENAWPM